MTPEENNKCPLEPIAERLLQLIKETLGHFSRSLQPDAEELAHDVFVQLLELHQKGCSLEELLAKVRWLTRTRRIEFFRKRMRRGRRATHWGDLNSTVDQRGDVSQQIVRSESIEKISACIEQLDEQYRVVIIGFYFEGKKQDRIARQLGTTRGSVVHMLRTGKQEMLRMLPTLSDR